MRALLVALLLALYALCPPPTVAAAAVTDAADGWAVVAEVGALLKQNPRYQRSLYRDATLTELRAALAEPDVVRALARTRAALALPFPAAKDEDPALKASGYCREAARLLALEMRVAFADGRTRAALQSLEDGLRLGHAIQSAGWLSAHTGYAVESIVLRTFSRRLDQLSARDCELIVALARRHLARPDTLPETLRAERARQAGLLAPLREMWSRPLTDADREKFASPPPRVWDEFVALAADPREQSALLTELEARFDALHEAAQARVEEAAAVSAAAAAPSPAPPAAIDLRAYLLNAFEQGYLLDYAKLGDKSRERRALVRLLGVHAALRRHRWEYGRWPESLEPLDLGALTIDPFNGKPLTYRHDAAADAYELESVGPRARTEDDDGYAPDGRRNPVTLPTTSPPPPRR